MGNVKESRDYGGPLVTKERTPYKIYCNIERKSVFLTLQEYQKQLDNTKKDGFWCPNCNSEDVSFDEQNYKEVMGIDRKSY